MEMLTSNNEFRYRLSDNELRYQKSDNELRYGACDVGDAMALAAPLLSGQTP